MAFFMFDLSLIQFYFLPLKLSNSALSSKHKQNRDQTKKAYSISTIWLHFIVHFMPYSSFYEIVIHPKKSNHPSDA